MKIEYKGRSIERISKKMNHKEIYITFLSECPIKEVKMTDRFKTFKLDTITIKEQSLNYGAKPVHSVKTANHFRRRKIDQKTAKKIAKTPTEYEVLKSAEKNTLSTEDNNFLEIMDFFNTA